MNILFQPITKVPEDPELEEIPDYGDHMTWEDFAECVACGAFINYDGHANLATATQCSKVAFSPSDVGNYKIPAWVTHVVWYNR